MTEGSLFAGMEPAVWDELVGSHFYSSSVWLQHCASYSGAGCSAVAFSMNGQTAAVPVAHFTEPPPANYHWHDILRGRGLPAPAPVGTLVGPRQGYQANLLGLAGDGARATTLAAGLVREARRAAATWSGAASPCVAMYLTTADVRLLREAGVQTLPVLLEPDAWIEVPAGGWEAWLASLTSKRRVMIRHEVRRFAEAGCEIAHARLADWQDSLVPASVSMAEKYRMNQGPEYFSAELKRYVYYTGDVARVAVCTQGEDEPLGFCVYYAWRDTVFLRWSSFNRALLTGSTEYFNVAFYSQVKLAGELGLRWLHAGKKAVEAKVLRGARLRPLWLLDLSENSVLHGHDKRIREHNARLLAALERHNVTSRALADRGDWELFC